MNRRVFACLAMLAIAVAALAQGNRDIIASLTGKSQRFDSVTGAPWNYWPGNSAVSGPYVFDPDGSIYYVGYRLTKIDIFSNVVWQSDPLGMNYRADLTRGPDGAFYATEPIAKRVVRIPADGLNPTDFVTPGANGLNYPCGVRFGPGGNLYVACASGDKILKYDGSTGAFLGIFAQAPDVDTPYYLEFKDGIMYASCNHSVRKFDAQTGALLGDVATFPGQSCSGLAFDDSGALFVFASPNLYKLDVATGQTLSTFTLGVTPSLTPINLSPWLTQIVPPASVTVAPGSVLSGDVISTTLSDDTYLVARPGVAFSNLSPSLVITFEATSPVIVPRVLGLTFEYHTFGMGAGWQNVEAFNFGTGTWQALANGPGVNVSPDARTGWTLMPAAQFVGPAGELRARVVCRQLGPVFAYPWKTYIDLMAWGVTQ